MVMYKKLYETPAIGITERLYNVITMSGTGFDDGNDNVFDSGVLGGIEW